MRKIVTSTRGIICKLRKFFTEQPNQLLRFINRSGQNLTLADLRNQGDLSFACQDWRGAVRAYTAFTEMLDKLWKVSVHLDLEQQETAEIVFPRLAYALAKKGKLRKAVLAIENGKARFFGRLILEHSLRA